jgi:hypothetical protein
MYCCRDDGYTHVNIRLPSTQPFVLLKLGDECQMVENMNVSEEWMHWAGEESVNLDTQEGLYPALERKREPPFRVYTRLYYCYYTPKAAAAPSNALQMFLLIVYIVCTIIGVALVIAIALATIQRFLVYRHLRRRRRQLESSLANPNSLLSGCSAAGYVRCDDEVVSNTRNKMVEALRPPSYEDASGPTPMQSVCDRRGQVSSAVVPHDESPPSYDDVLREGRCQDN